MDPTLIGYFPKHILPRPDWLKVELVKEVCSVSECVSPGPEGWIDHWAHNDLWVFNDERAAWGVVPEGRSNPGFHLFAYRLFPVEFVGGKSRPFPIPPLSVQPLPDGYRWLGYDVVSRWCGSSFECSPLSCNHAAEHHAVNEHCLVADLADALRLGALFSRVENGYEPGPYFIVEVWRRESEVT
jgi:hypothetical protein